MAFISAAGLCALAGVLLGIDLFYAATVPVPVRGGAYREGVVGQPAFVNPVFAGDNEADIDLTRILFSNLPALSDSIKSSGYGKVWDVRLRDGTLWHDGEPLTSDDVLFTIRTIQDPDARSPLLPLWQGVRAERVSGREVRLTLPSPYAYFTSTLQELRPIPQHLFGSIPASNFKLSNYILENPVGDGSYKFASFTRRADGFITEYALERVSVKGEGAPYFDGITFKFYEDEDALLTAYNNRAIDGFGGVQYGRLRALTVRYEISTLQLPQYYAVFFNQSANPVLRDKAVRTALVYATPQRELIAKIFDGRALPVTGPLTPLMEGYASGTREVVDAGSDKAAALLDQAGWQVGADGVRALPGAVVSTQKNGASVPQALRLEFTLTVPEVPFLLTTASMLQEAWSKIGVKVAIQSHSLREMDEIVLKPRNYKLLLFGNLFGSNPDLFSFWHSSQRLYPGLNLALYSNPTADIFLDSVRRNFDPQGRATDLATLQSMIAGDVPAIFLYAPDYLYVTWPGIHGFKTQSFALPSDRLQGIATWYSKTARMFK